MRPFDFASAILLGTALALASPALAAAQQPRPQAPGKPAEPAERNSALGNLGGNSREPIKIDADRLDVFDRESRAVFAGNVVAVQGETTMRCTTLTVHYENRQPGAPRAAGAPGDNAIRQIECKGPVTVASKEQIVTGDNATFDRVANKVLITGNVALSQCQNVTRGERVVYDLNSGVANVETAPGKRVQALFVPGGGDNQPKSGCQSAPAPAPARAQAAQPAPAKPAPRQRAQN
jgi:lipopolysaccharide export system protein LptA